MFVMFAISFICFCLFHISSGDTGSQAVSDNGKYVIQINIQTELKFLRNQLIQESSLRMQLQQEISDINRRLRQLYNDFDPIKNENPKLKKHSATQTMSTVERFQEIGSILNSTKLDIKELNNSMTSTIDQTKIHLKELGRDLNDIRDESVQNFSTIGTWIKDLEMTVNKQTMHQRTIDKALNLTTDKIDEVNTKLAHVNITVNRLNTFVEENVIPSGMECKDLLIRNSTLQSGVYRIRPHSDPRRSYDVYCDMDTDGGGWTVFQRRMDGSENFQREYSDYRIGFGNLSREFWLGNEALHTITQGGQYQMRVEMETFSGDKLYAKYTNFSVGDELSGYQLHISGFSGNAGDSMTYANGAKFSTADKDQDTSGGNCAERYSSPFWHKACTYTTPNGRYMTTERYIARDYKHGILWYHYKNTWNISMKKFKMMLRRS